MALSGPPRTGLRIKRSRVILSKSRSESGRFEHDRAGSGEQHVQDLQAMDESDAASFVRSTVMCV